MNQKGFTLFEINACCVIIAIVASIGLPALSKIKERFVLKSEAQILFRNLHLAKSEAVKHNDYVVFRIKNDSYEIFVDNGQSGGKGGDWKHQPGEKLLVSHSLKKGVTLAKSTFTSNKTRFTGTAGVKAGRVILQNTRGKQCEIVVSTVGRIRVALL